MSYDLSLNDPTTHVPLTLDAPHHMRGGTYPLDGEPRARLNVTYNYAPHFKRTLGPLGIRTLYGKTGAESIPLLTQAIDQLNEADIDPDYWAATEGNARQALCHLLTLAAMRPEGVWNGD